MPTAVADVSTVLSTLPAVAPKPRALWPYGPELMAGERKNSSPYLDQYADWVAQVEASVANSGEAAQRLRMLYYGAATGNSAFDMLLTAGAWQDAPLTTKQASQAALTGLAATGMLTTSDNGTEYARPPVDVSHVWVLLDQGFNGLGTVGGAVNVRTDVAGALSWTGDLASWWSSYNDAKIKARTAAKKAGQTWSEPTDASGLATPLGWLTAATASRCALDDLFGDMDAEILKQEIGSLAVTPTRKTPLADLLRSYYGPEPPQVGNAMVHSVNRFHLFIHRATPAIPHTIDSSGVVTIDPAAVRAAVRTQLEKTAFDLLTLGRFKTSKWLYLAEAALSPLGAGIDLLGSVRADLTSPWGAAMLDEIAKRFTDFLVAGLAGYGWTTGGWPQWSTDASLPRRRQWPLLRYGNFTLRLGDSDSARRYGGQATAVATPQTYVRNLQEDLVALGFAVVGTPDGEFGGRTAIALRELQIEAQADTVYQLQAAPAQGTAVVATAYRYRGRVHGMADWDTAEVIAQWINPDRAVRNICPLTVAGYPISTPPPAAPDPSYTDLWLYNDMKAFDRRVYSTDQLGRFAIPPSRQFAGAVNSMAIGAYSAAGSNGPILDQNQYWQPECQVTMDSLLPPELIPPAPVDRSKAPVSSTYRVIRAVASQECIGNFDVYNAWDAGIISFGLYHWALLSSGTGELAAVYAYYRDQYPDSYERDFGRYGIYPAVPWDATVWSGQGGAAQSKYVGQLGMYGLRDKNGQVHAADLLPLAKSTDAYMIDYMRSWHVLHRLVVALRGSDDLHRAMWKLALRRLRDLLARSWDSRSTPNPGPRVPNGSGGLRVATFGEVLTSERAVAALLRHHVNRPDHVINANGAISDALSAYQTAFGTGNVNMATENTTAKQEAFVTELIALANGEDPVYGKTVQRAADYKDAEAGKVVADVNSFQLIAG
ncbi:peptidoglycan-binding domain-containing protein [Micromonospora sp. NPDC003776]